VDFSQEAEELSFELMRHLNHLKITLDVMCLYDLLGYYFGVIATIEAVDFILKTGFELCVH
jgi:hypothetical protein